MAVYKVIQDIEAEDKLLGPLTLKGFVYAAITGILAFISIRLAISGSPMLLKIIFIVLSLPPMVLFGVLASPLGREQPTEVWLLSRIKFMFKNHERRWDQSGIKQLVTITVPKKIELHLTKNISKAEASSRLQALANTLDSRGWAIKNVAINAPAGPIVQPVEENDERLAGATTAGQSEPVLDVHPADDILDEQNNPAAQNMQSLIEQAEQQRKAEMMERLESARSQAAKAEGDKKSTPAPQNQTSSSGLTPQEEALLQKVHSQESELKLHPPKIIKGATRDAVMTPIPQTVKMELANAGGDISVASIARLASNQVMSNATVGPL